MALDPITAGLDLINNLIDRFVPDRTKAAELKAQAQAAHEAGDLQRLQLIADAAKAQLDVNLQEAKSASRFVAGWRPGAGWVCVVGLALCYWPKAIVLTALWVYQAYSLASHGGSVPAYPDMGLNDLVGLLGTLLGIGTLRTAEKITNTESNR